MTPSQLNYFHNMVPGHTLSVEQVKDPDVMVSAAKEYIDIFRTLEFNSDFTVVKKLRPIPKTDDIGYFFDF